MSEENKRLVREITAVVWNSRGLDRIPELYAPDFVADYRPYAPLREGHEGIRGMVERAWTAFPTWKLRTPERQSLQRASVKLPA